MFVPAKSDETDGLLHRLSKQREDGNSASFTHSLKFELEQNQFHFPSPLCVIAVSPKITDISPDISINEGGNVSLTCIATGRPDPTITWRHISPKGKNQALPEISREGHSILCEWLGRGWCLIQLPGEGEMHQKRCDSTQGLMTLVEKHSPWWSGRGADGFWSCGGLAVGARLVLLCLEVYRIREYSP